MYQHIITCPNRALLHLLIFCSHKDGELHADEVAAISALTAALPQMHNMNVAEEIEVFKSYSRGMKDESHYLAFLLRTIKPVRRLALLWMCAQLTVTDTCLSFSEEVLLYKIGSALHIRHEECNLLQELAWQQHGLSKEQKI